MKNYVKNVPRLFGKKLNTLFRSNKYFIKKKQKLFHDNEKIKKFDDWLDENAFEKLRSLKKYRELWSKRSGEFEETFIEFSYIFFSKFAVRYVANSNIQNKKMILKLIPQYLKGIKNPEGFQRQL